MAGEAREPWSLGRLAREPLVHFLLIGGLLFGAEHLLRGNPRKIVVSQAIRAELARVYQDTHGRAPDALELEGELKKWQREEALFREAERRGLERDDAVVRGALIGKMRTLAALEVPEPKPTQAELDAWLAQHRSRYELPLRYDFEFVEFPLGEVDVRPEAQEFLRAVGEGASPARRGRPLKSAKLTAADLPGRVPPELAERLPGLAPGWHLVEGARALLAVHLKGVDGGLPPAAELRARLESDWALSRKEAETERVLDQTVNLYRFEVQP